MSESGQSTTGGREYPVAPGVPAAATVTAPATAAPRPRARRVPRTLGAGAGLLAVCLVLFTIGGAVWGLLRPAYRGTVAEDGGVLLDRAFDIEFTSFISFVITTGLLSSAVALTVFNLSPRTRGPGMMLWLLVVTVLSSLAFHQAGMITAGLAHPLPDPETLAVGTRVSLMPGFSPGVGMVAAPFMATLTYWCAALVTPDEEPEQASVG